MDWIKYDTNVVKVGDKLIDPTESFSRLDYYTKHMGIKFCSEDELTVPCGEICLNNDMLICYNVITEIMWKYSLSFIINSVGECGYPTRLS